MKFALHSLSLALLPLFASIARAAEEQVHAPSPMVSTFWVFVFFAIFVGVCAWIGIAIWRAERKSKDAS